MCITPSFSITGWRCVVQHIQLPARPLPVDVRLSVFLCHNMLRKSFSTIRAGHFRRNYRPVVNSSVARVNPRFSASISRVPSRFVHGSRPLSSFSKRPSAAVKRGRSSRVVRKSKRVRKVSKVSKKRSRGSSSSNGSTGKRQKKLSSKRSSASSSAPSSRSSRNGNLVERSNSRSLARGSTVDRTSLRRNPSSSSGGPGLARPIPPFPSGSSSIRTGLAGSSGVVGPMGDAIGGVISAISNAIEGKKQRKFDTQMFNRQLNTGNYQAAVSGGQMPISRKYTVRKRKRGWYDRLLRNFLRGGYTRTQSSEIGMLTGFVQGEDRRKDGTTVWAQWNFRLANIDLVSAVSNHIVYRNTASTSVQVPGSYYIYCHKLMYDCFILNPYSVPYNYRIYYGIYDDFWFKDSTAIQQTNLSLRSEEGNPMVWDCMQRWPVCKVMYKSMKCLRFRLQPGERKDFKFGFRPGFVLDGTTGIADVASDATKRRGKNAYLLVMKWVDHLIGLDSAQVLRAAQLKVSSSDVGFFAKSRVKITFPRELTNYMQLHADSPPLAPFDSVTLFSPPLDKVFVPNMVETKAVSF